MYMLNLLSTKCSFHCYCISAVLQYCWVVYRYFNIPWYAYYTGTTGSKISFTYIIILLKIIKIFHYKVSLYPQQQVLHLFLLLQFLLQQRLQVVHVIVSEVLHLAT